VITINHRSHPHSRARTRRRRRRRTLLYCRSHRRNRRPKICRCRALSRRPHRHSGEQRGHGANGAAGRSKPLSETSFAEWQNQIAITLHTAFPHDARRPAPGMTQQKYGRIVNITSVTGPLVSNRGSAAHGAAKAAMDGMMRAVAIETAGDGLPSTESLPAGFPLAHQPIPKNRSAAYASRPPRHARRSRRRGLLPRFAGSFLHYRASSGHRWRQYPPGKQGLLTLPFSLAGISTLRQLIKYLRIERF